LGKNIIFFFFFLVVVPDKLFLDFGTTQRFLNKTKNLKLFFFAVAAVHLSTCRKKKIEQRTSTPHVDLLSFYYKQKSDCLCSCAIYSFNTVYQNEGGDYH